MTKRRTQRQASRAMRQRSKADGERPKGKSRYARKKSYLKRFGGFGFDYPMPKPWRGGAQ